MIDLGMKMALLVGMLAGICGLSLLVAFAVVKGLGWPDGSGLLLAVAVFAASVYGYWARRAHNEGPDQ